MSNSLTDKLFEFLSSKETATVEDIQALNTDPEDVEDTPEVIEEVPPTVVEETKPGVVVEETPAPTNAVVEKTPNSEDDKIAFVERQLFNMILSDFGPEYHSYIEMEIRAGKSPDELKKNHPAMVLKPQGSKVQRGSTVGAPSKKKTRAQMF